jgi:photosystem II stability/assembly factor-like uncharacterized protein
MKKILKNKKSIFLSLLVISSLTMSLAGWAFNLPARATSPSEAAGAAISCLEMDPRDSRVIYAGTRDGLFKTENSGVNWESIELKNLIVWDVEAFGNIVYVATNKGIYKSTNGGEDWTFMPEKIGELSLLTFSGTNPDIVYTSNGKTIFKSIDGAAIWRTLERNLPSDVFSVVQLEVDPADPQIVYTRVQLAKRTGEFTHEITGEVVFKTIDGGEAWSEISGFEFERSDLIIDPHNPNIQYKATSIGVAKSKDGGKTWETTGWVARSAISLIVDQADPDTIYVGTEGNGVWRSVDRGIHWDEAGLEGAIVYSLEAAFEERGGLILAVAGTDRGIFKAHKSIRAETWDLAGAGNFGGYVTIDPQNPGIFYAGSRLKIFRDPQNPDIFSVDEGGKEVLKSLDAGETWVPKELKPLTTFSSIRYITIDPHNSAVVYAINNDNGGIYKSINAGENWQRISAGLEGAYASSLVVAPDDPNTLYLGIWEAKGEAVTPGVFRSNDGGNTWRYQSLANKKIRTLKIDSSTTPYTIYAGTYGQGAYKSTNKGETWVSLDEELILQGVSVNAIAVVTLPTSITFHPFLKNLIEPVFAAPQQTSLLYLATDEGVHAYEVSAEEVKPIGEEVSPPEEKPSPEIRFTPFHYFVIIFFSIVILGLIGWRAYRKRKGKIM